MQNISIVTATLQDLPTLKALAIQTFTEAFAENNDPDAVAAYLESSFTDEKLSAELNNPESYFFIAWDGAIPVGYLKLNTGHAQTELQDDGALEIERIYVLRDYLGKKVGQLLYEKALAEATQQDKGFIWLGVWEENTRAIKFYSKNGFTAFDKHIFMLGNEAQTDIMMRRELI
jgi:ribosomal protein S18 acetylase RimI-like enzyme